MWSDFTDTKYLELEASAKMSGPKLWRHHPTRGSLASAALIFTSALLPRMPGWAWHKLCCGTWLPEEPALG